MYPSHLCFLPEKKMGYYSHFIDKELKHNLPTYPQDKGKQVQTHTRTAMCCAHHLPLSCTKANLVCLRARRYDRTVQSTSASLIKLYGETRFPSARGSVAELQPSVQRRVLNCRQNVREFGLCVFRQFQVLIPGRNTRNLLNRTVCRIAYLSILIFQLTSRYGEVRQHF